MDKNGIKKPVMLIKGQNIKQKQNQSPIKRMSYKHQSCSPKLKTQFEVNNVNILTQQDINDNNQKQQQSQQQQIKKTTSKNTLPKITSMNNISGSTPRNSSVRSQKRSLSTKAKQKLVKIYSNNQENNLMIQSQQKMIHSAQNQQLQKIQNIQEGLKPMLDVITEKRPQNKDSKKGNKDSNNTNGNSNKDDNTNNNKKKKDSNKKQKLKLTQLKDLKPLNLEQEKHLFFQKQYQYNPIFLYSSQDILFSIQNPHTKHMSLAVKILNAVVDQHQSEDQWNVKEGGDLLTQEQTQEHFQKYIDDLDIADLITFEFSENTISPTTCIHNNVEGVSKVVIGLPITYRKHRIQGVLNHEIGTHFLRKYNDKLQRWHKYRKKYDLQNHSKVEEGLASINQLFNIAQDQKKKPYLFRAALHYYASVQASYMSFQDLFRDLEKYVKNPEQRWKQCVRVKRGITNTQQKNGQYKDQIYLRGAVKVLNFRNQINFHNLHAGKITVKDCIRLTEKNFIATDKSKMPYFIKDISAYKKALDRIAQCNFIQ